MAARKEGPRVLLLSDSRGRDLEELLNANLKGISFRVMMESGATINRIKEKLLRINKDSLQGINLIIVFAGVCNTTKIVYQPSRMAVLRYSEVDKIVSEFMRECTDLIESARAAINVPVMLAPTVGINMTAYAGYHNAALFAQQPTVDNAVIQINSYIREVNAQNGLITPNTSYCIHRNKGKGKGYRTHYIKLYDGCHPSDEVKTNWSEALVSCCVKFFNLT